ncbi:MAG: NAD(P)/FAD-dependent oxidoreductase [Bacteriovoracaceae bacterium]
MSDVKQIAIIGGGAAGVMAALRGVLNNDKVTMFMGAAKEKKKSRALWVARVDNIPGYDHFKKGIVNPNQSTIQSIESGPFAENFSKKAKSIVEINKDGEVFKLKDNDGELYEFDYVVLATGVMDVQPHIQDSIEPILPYANVQLVDYCIRCDGHHVHGKNTAVIGHTSGAAWVAVMLHERYNVPQMTIITNGEEPQFDEETRRLIELYGFEVETSPILHISGNAREKILNSFTLEDGTIVESEAAFVSLGMLVYNELAKKLGAEVDERGFVITGPKGETNIQNLYAVGDVQAGKKKQIYTGWDSAVDALDDINGKIRREKRQALLNK